MLRQSDRLRQINIDAWLGKSVSFERLNKHQDALHCSDKALEIDPQSLVAW